MLACGMVCLLRHWFNDSSTMAEPIGLTSGPIGVFRACLGISYRVLPGTHFARRTGTSPDSKPRDWPEWGREHKNCKSAALALAGETTRKPEMLIGWNGLASVH